MTHNILQPKRKGASICAPSLHCLSAHCQAHGSRLEILLASIGHRANSKVPEQERCCLEFCRMSDILNVGRGAGKLRPLFLFRKTPTLLDTKIKTSPLQAAPQSQSFKSQSSRRSVALPTLPGACQCLQSFVGQGQADLLDLQPRKLSGVLFHVSWTH